MSVRGLTLSRRAQATATYPPELRCRQQARGQVVRYIHHMPTNPEFLIVGVEGHLTERYLVEHPTRHTFRLTIMDMWTFKHDQLHLKLISRSSTAHRPAPTRR